jgi:hypothetical protein
MVGAMQRHLRSLRKMTHDGGFISHLLHEAENERMHLMVSVYFWRKELKFMTAALLGNIWCIDLDEMPAAKCVEQTAGSGCSRSIFQRLFPGLYDIT